MARRWMSKQNRDTDAKTGGWQVIYTGFILIMLCFFIMLTSFTSLQQSKVTRFVRAFSTAMSILNGGLSLEKGKTMFEAESLILDKEEQLARLFEAVSMYSEDLNIDRTQLQISERGVVMTLADTLLFDSGKAELASGARSLLHQVAQLIHKIDVPVEIEGHTDNVPIATAAFPSNWELSTARAVNVLRFLLDQMDVNASQLSAVGMSEYQPVASNASPTGRARNRRVVFVFKPRENEASDQ
jgi:chemotaxis protein MotB